MTEQGTPVLVRWWFTDVKSAVFERMNTGLDVLRISSTTGNIIQQVVGTRYSRSENGELLGINKAVMGNDFIYLPLHHLQGTEAEITRLVQGMVRKLVMSLVGRLVVVSGIVHVVLGEAAFHDQPMTYARVGIAYTRDMLRFQDTITKEGTGTCPIDLFGSGPRPPSRYERPLVI